MLQYCLLSQFKKRPVVIEGQDGTDSIAIRHTGMLSLTWDHRAFDGSSCIIILKFHKREIRKL